jgi:hypothetical protein
LYKNENIVQGTVVADVREKKQGATNQQSYEMHQGYPLQIGLIFSFGCML